ncbi:MAG TPA: phage holin family protein [Opitutaceae bacterium]|nr:phage holin family protein [Opitutaceae bacterium]
MDAATLRPAGIVEALRALGRGLLARVDDRIDLFAFELHAEKLRLIRIVIWTGAAVFTAFMALTFGSILLVYLFWDSARLAVLGGLTAIYFGAFAIIVWRLRRWLDRQPKPFAATLQIFGRHPN